MGDGVLPARRGSAVRVDGALQPTQMLSALRQTLRMAWRLDYLTADEYQRAADVGRSAAASPRRPPGARFPTANGWRCLPSVQSMIHQPVCAMLPLLPY